MMEIEDIPNHSFWKNYLFLTSLYCPGYDLSPIGSALQSSMILPRLTPGECQPWGGEEARWLGLGGSFWKPPWGRRHAEEQDMPAPNPRALPTPWQLQAGHRGHPCLPLGKVATLQEEWPGCCPVLLGPWYVLAVSSQEKGFMVEKSTKNVEGVMVTLTAEQNLKLLSSRHGAAALLVGLLVWARAVQCPVSAPNRRPTPQAGGVHSEHNGAVEAEFPMGV
ncbi:epididymal-specific lipocalin-6 isoform X10 [Sciurus carolinensis]|uniref:epididymal-specific lipocalin-6 isoform X10 n=1 Tax=Sciurus carolinensis TaxID=30640 RepID=UPI001FB45437|nr:epididymal-specific lipocalin-6 isoform X10 [Sciurus carolinensis]XP_047379692.1 epididymal-specific lipocalin-6 isoform X10 [Sciurus carolinensis]